MKAALDFALCVRPTRSCSRHGDCARAQFATLNQDRQSFVWPTDTGNACPLFFDYSPFRKLASTGGGIADVVVHNLALSEIVAPGKTPTTDSANDGTESPETVQLSAGPNSGKLAAGSGEPGVASDTERVDASPAGEILAASKNPGQLATVAESGDAFGGFDAADTSADGLDTAAAFGFILVQPATGLARRRTGPSDANSSVPRARCASDFPLRHFPAPVCRGSKPATLFQQNSRALNSVSNLESITTKSR